MDYGTHFLPRLPKAQYAPVVQYRYSIDIHYTVSQDRVKFKLGVILRNHPYYDKMTRGQQQLVKIETAQFGVREAKRSRRQSLSLLLRTTKLSYLF